MRGRFAGIVADAAAHNLFVIPIAVGDKVPLEKWKHLQSRAPTPEEIADWCDRFPNANGAFVTGAIQGRIVVDTDSEAGSEYVEKREVPETQMVRTRERRLHYHFRHPGFPVRNSAGELYDDVDVRGDGGLATAPGSIGKTGYVYRWEPGHSPAEIELASAPNWLIDWLYEQHQRRCARSPITDPRPFDGAVGNWARAAIDRELETLAAARNGTRNATLARVSFKLGQLVGGGEADGETVRAALEAMPVHGKTNAASRVLLLRGRSMKGWRIRDGGPSHSPGIAIHGLTRLGSRASTRRRWTQVEEDRKPNPFQVAPKPQEVELARSTIGKKVARIPVASRAPQNLARQAIQYCFTSGGKRTIVMFNGRLYVHRDGRYVELESAHAKAIISRFIDRDVELRDGKDTSRRRRGT